MAACWMPSRESRASTSASPTGASPKLPPHVPALAPEYEQEPKSKILRSHIPLDAVPYKVEDGDSFESLAVFSGWNARDLIYYNFQTKDPIEVNWYLRNYTGCKLRTWDQKNFSFSTDADPGIIFFPSWAYKKLIASGKEPQPFFSEDDEFHVPGLVPAVFQGFGPTCWAGAASSMIRYKRGGPHKISELLESVGKKWKIAYERNQGLDREEMFHFAGACGLTGLLYMPANVLDCARLLRRHGPLMVIQNVSRAWTHWIVVTGFRIEVPSTFEVKIMDPGNSTRRYRSAESVWEDAKAVVGPWTSIYHW